MSQSITLTAVEGLEVGHAERDDRPTGCTVVLARDGAVAGVDVRGGAPGTRETDLLRPEGTVQEAHAVLLSGGSAFGLAAADGVMGWLREREVGYPTGAGPVPIVPAAILYDLGIGDTGSHPDAVTGRAACEAAGIGPVAEGSVGAGAGATVGKMLGGGAAMKGGVGSAGFRFDDGVVVAALVAVNCRGDVRDPASGEIVAGARAEGGGFRDAWAELLRPGAALPDPGGPGGPVASSGAAGSRGSGSSSGTAGSQGSAGSPASSASPGPTNTTIGVVATNLSLTQAQCRHLASAAHDGIARAITPAHTRFDGDTLFALATGRAPAPGSGREHDRLEVAAAAAVAEAIVRAVRAATGLPGFPAVRDLA